MFYNVPLPEYNLTGLKTEILNKHIVFLYGDNHVSGFKGNELVIFVMTIILNFKIKELSLLIIIETYCILSSFLMH